MAVDMLAFFNIGYSVTNGVAVFNDIFAAFNIAKGILVADGKINLYIIKPMNFHYFILPEISAVKKLKSSPQSSVFSKISLMLDFFINAVTLGSSLVISVL